MTRARALPRYCSWSPRAAISFGPQAATPCGIRPARLAQLSRFFSSENDHGRRAGVPHRRRRKVATEPVVDFGYGITNAVLTAAVFFGVLWSASGSADFFGCRIPGFMV